MKDEGAVDHNTVSRGFKKCHLSCKNSNNQAISSRPKTADSEAVVQAIEANL